MLLPRLRAVGRSLASSVSSRRTVWTTSTLVSSSPSSLVSQLLKQSPVPPTATATVYALSKNTPQSLVPYVQAALPREAVGVLSEPLPAPLVSSTSSTPSPAAEDELFFLAVASFVPHSSTSSSTVHAIPFRSTLTGRPNISLGREHKLQPDHNEGDAGFEAFLRGEKWEFGQSKAEQGEADGLEELTLAGVRSEDVREIVCFTADRQGPFLSALSSYRNASIAGLVGSSTPFHSPTGSAFSLFPAASREAVETGAVGVAIVSSARSEVEQTPAKVEYGGLEPLGKPMEVTSARGNIVLLLSAQNAARTLLNEVNTFFGTHGESLSAVQRSEEKDKEFYAAVFEREPEAPLDLSKARLVARIMAGDPSRGAMSVETEEEVREGSWLVFLHRPSTASPSLPSPSSSPSLTFLTLPPSYTPPHLEPTTCPTTGKVKVLEGVFLAGSENGVVHGTEDGRARVCAIEGVSVQLG
ncbi:hypothetical protein JCM10207_003628 [Rhodosporidiobolus poonsookiae]